MEQPKSKYDEPITWRDWLFATGVLTIQFGSVFGLMKVANFFSELKDEEYAVQKKIELTHPADKTLLAYQANLFRSLTDMNTVSGEDIVKCMRWKLREFTEKHPGNQRSVAEQQIHAWAIKEMKAVDETWGRMGAHRYTLDLGQRILKQASKAQPTAVKITWQQPLPAVCMDRVRA